MKSENHFYHLAEQFFVQDCARNSQNITLGGKLEHLRAKHADVAFCIDFLKEKWTVCVLVFPVTLKLHARLHASGSALFPACRAHVLYALSSMRLQSKSTAVCMTIFSARPLRMHANSCLMRKQKGLRINEQLFLNGFGLFIIKLKPFTAN